MGKWSSDKNDSDYEKTFTKICQGVLMPFIRSHKRVYQIKQYDKKGVPEVTFFENEEKKTNYIKALDSQNIPHSEIPMDVNKFGFLENETFQQQTSQDVVTGTRIVFERVPKRGEDGKLVYTIIVDYPAIRSFVANGSLKKLDVEHVGLDPEKDQITKEFPSYSSASKYYYSVQKNLSNITKTKLGVK